MPDGARAVESASVAVEMTHGDFAKWSPVAVVEKWDEDQTEWVRRKTGILEPSGDVLSQHVAPYEVRESVGNLLTTAGLNRLTSLLIGAGGQALTNTATRLGVGNSNTAAAVGQTDLQAAAGAGNRQFKVMDATFPQQSNGVVTAKATYPTGEANFVWNEWCLDIGSPTVADGTTVNAVMLNRRVESLGTKASGSWALTVTVTIS